MSHLGLNILSAIQGMPAIWHVRYWEVSLYLFYAADKPLCRGHNFPNKKYQQAPKGRFLVLFLHHYLCIKIIKYQHWKLTNIQFLYFMTDYYLHIITDNPENLMEFDFRFCHWIIGNKQHLWLLIGFWNSRLRFEIQGFDFEIQGFDITIPICSKSSIKTMCEINVWLVSISNAILGWNALNKGSKK